MVACQGTVNERVVSHLPLCMGLALYIAACLLFAYAFYQRVLVSVYVVPLRTRRREQASPACAHSMTDKLMEDLDVGASGVATLGGSYYFAYASLQILSVLFVDWFGVVESLVRTLFARSLSTIHMLVPLQTVMALLCAVGAATFGLATSISVAIAGRALVGGATGRWHAMQHHGYANSHVARVQRLYLSSSSKSPP